MTSQPIARQTFVSASSSRRRNARTVLLRMARDQERADRIRALKQEHPETTWQAIADHCRVSLRAAQMWQEKGGIEYDNAQKLAELWKVETDYIWRGEPVTPPLMENLRGDGQQLDRIEALLERIATQLEGAAVPAPEGTLLQHLEDAPPSAADRSRSSSGRGKGTQRRNAR